MCRDLIWYDTDIDIVWCLVLYLVTL